jgi:hypothetical protein
MTYQLLTVVVLGLLLGTARVGAANISGTWDFSVSLDGGPQNVTMTFVFQQEGEKLNGAPSGGASESKVSGTVKGTRVVFNVEGKNRSGEPFKNTFTGTLESATKMTGTCEFPKGPGKWTATKR